MFALVARELVLGDVGGVQNRLHREQRERTQKLELFPREVRLPEPASLFEKIVGALNDRQLDLRLLVADAGGALRLLEPLFDGAEVGQRQLELDDLSIAHRIDTSH